MKLTFIFLVFVFLAVLLSADGKKVMKTSSGLSNERF